MSVSNHTGNLSLTARNYNSTSISSEIPTDNTNVLDQYTNAYWYWTSIVIIGVITVWGNGLVMYLILTRRRLHVTANWFILSLAFSDFLIGIIIVPSYVANNFGLDTNFSVLILFYNLLFYVSVGNLCVMTLDRYIAVTRPLKYVRFMTKRKVALFIALAWVIPTIISLLPLAWRSNDDHTAAVATASRIYNVATVIGLEILPCAVMLLIYARLFIIVRKHFRQISLQRVATLGLNIRSFRSQERSNLKVFCVVVIIFAVCWVLSAYRTLCKKLELCHVSILMLQMSRLLMFCNSAINFFVYAVLKRDVKKELKNLWSKCKHDEFIKPLPQSSTRSFISKMAAVLSPE